MSQLKKQSIAGRGKQRQNARTSVKSSGRFFYGLRKFFSFVFKITSRVGAFILKPVVLTMKRWPAMTLLVSATGLTCVGLGYGAHRLERSMNQALPETIEVNAPRSDLTTSVSKVANSTLQTARTERWSRTALTDKLLSRISLIDGVDEVSIRAGLDKKIKIEVAAQSPLLVFEGKDAERILVGNKFKIISRGVDSRDYAHLPVLEAPELTFNAQGSREKRKAQYGLFVRPAASSNANIRWLAQQTLKIKSLFPANQLSFEIEKLSWRNGTGFALRLVNNNPGSKSHGDIRSITALPEHSSGPSTGNEFPTSSRHINVILGEGHLNKKFDRLKEILQDIRLKNTAVEQIDLAFSDKAIIRMSEDLSAVKRGSIP